jgi:hypothetical protein
MFLRCLSLLSLFVSQNEGLRKPLTNIQIYIPE